MPLKPILWADLWDFLRAEEMFLVSAQAELHHPLLEEAIEMHTVLMQQIALINSEHGLPFQESYHV